MFFGLAQENTYLYSAVELQHRIEAMSIEFSTGQAAEITGTTTRMLGHWDRTGLVRPSGKRAHGKGSRRKYTFGDIVAIQTVRRLRSGGCPLQKIRAAVGYIRKHHSQPSDSHLLKGLTLVTDGSKVLVVTDGDQLMEVMSHQMVWCIPLGHLIMETAKAIGSASLRWTENIRIGRDRFRVTVDRDAGADEYTAYSRELPGFLVRARSPEEVMAKATAAIVAVVEHESSLERRRVQTARVG